MPNALGADCQSIRAVPENLTHCVTKSELKNPVSAAAQISGRRAFSLGTIVAGLMQLIDTEFAATIVAGD